MAALNPVGPARGAGLRTAVLVGALVLLFFPLVAAATFGFSLPGQGFTLDPLLTVVSSATFWPQLWISAQLMVLCTLGSLILLIPTLILLHLRVPGLLPATDGLSVIPMVVPAVALVSGANLFFRAVFPGFLVSVYSLVPFYMILSLPLVYRSLDAGIRALDLRTLMDAGASLGAGWWQSILSIVLPNMRTAILNAALLSITLCFGEFALASLLLHNTFPVFVVQVGQSQPRGAAALSFMVILATWLITQVIATATSRLRSTRRDS